MNLCARVLLAPAQLVQTQLDLRVQPLAESFVIFSKFEPIQERLRLVFIQAFDPFDCQFNATHTRSVAQKSMRAIQRLLPIL